MATNFPTGLDNLSNPSDSTTMNGGGNVTLGHAKQHADVNDAVEAIEAVIGVTNSADVNSIQYKLAQLLLGGSSSETSQIAFFPTSTAPTGYLKANGAQVSRTTYAALFAKIGTSFGAGNGSTTFTLPDFRGEFIRGWDDGRGVDTGRTLGSYQADEFKSHTHEVRAVAGAYKGVAEFASGVFAVGQSGATGGAETRPRNIALLACIKY